MLLLKNLFSIRFYPLNPSHPCSINNLLGIQGIAKEQELKNINLNHLANAKLDENNQVDF